MNGRTVGFGFPQLFAKQKCYDTAYNLRTVISGVNHEDSFIVPHSMVPSIGTFLSQGSKLATSYHLRFINSSGRKNTNAIRALNPYSTDVNTTEFRR